MPSALIYIKFDLLTYGQNRCYLNGRKRILGIHIDPCCLLNIPSPCNMISQNFRKIKVCFFICLIQLLFFWKRAHSCAMSINRLSHRLVCISLISSGAPVFQTLTGKGSIKEHSYKKAIIST